MASINMSRRVTTAALGLALALGAGALSGVTATVASSPTLAQAASSVGGEITRAEVLDRAQLWVDKGYTYDQGASAPDSDGKLYRKDCSGLVSMAWHLGSSPNTDSYLAGAVDTTTLASLHDLKPGDAMVRSGHMELFSHWKSNSDHTQGAYVYSFNVDGESVRGPYDLSNRGNRGFNSWSELQTYRPIRYDKIKDDAAPLSNAVMPGDVTGDGYADIIAIKPNGTLWYYGNNWNTDSSKPYGAGYQIGSGWGSFDEVSLGDVTGDGYADIIGTKEDGTLWYYGNNRNAHPDRPYGSGSQIGTGWGNVNRLMLGDVTGDGYADIVATKVDGTLWYFGNNRNSDPSKPYGVGRQIGSGWSGFNKLSVGDVTGDGYVDIIGTKTDGTLWYYGNNWNADSATPYGAGSQIGSGWSGFDRLALGDVSGDGLADIVATKPDGSLWYYGNIRNSDPSKLYSTGRAIGSGWDSF
ncbi:FG-GAP repeat domain-containing protein [Micromonospora azadirachtae]|uniref:FG-GAP repeat domain-containing protein n=1 Tax=Micromonospora azadirachtae TaxID=1970735 RepID=A0ABW2ZZC4_9ACTN